MSNRSERDLSSWRSKWFQIVLGSVLMAGGALLERVSSWLAALVFVCGLFWLLFVGFPRLQRWVKWTIGLTALAAAVIIVLLPSHQTASATSFESSAQRNGVVAQDINHSTITVNQNTYELPTPAVHVSYPPRSKAIAAKAPEPSDTALADVSAPVTREARQRRPHVKVASGSGSSPTQPPSQGNGNINIQGQSGSNNINNTGSITIYQYGQQVQCGFLQPGQALYTTQAEAAFLKNTLYQFQHWPGIANTKHVTLSAALSTQLDGVPIGFVDWVEALMELSREGSVSNVTAIPNSSWCYTLVGAHYAFASDYSFDIVNVDCPNQSCLPKSSPAP